MVRRIVFQRVRFTTSSFTFIFSFPNSSVEQLAKDIKHFESIALDYRFQPLMSFVIYFLHGIDVLCPLSN